jgi:putative ABC transport system permease protein
MTVRRLVARSLRFYWRTHLGVFLGATLAGAILIGALAVGDSVRYGLERQALARIGQARLALATQDRFFREELADDIGTELHAAAAPLLVARGTVSTPDSKHRANEVQIVGVDEKFWTLGSDKNLLAGAGDAVANERLAAQLGVQPGATLVIRTEEPSYVSHDAPLSGQANTSSAFNARFRAVAGDAQFGRFSLQANQVPPLTVFVPLKTLQQQLKRPTRANALLVGNSAGGESGVAAAASALAKHFKLADAGCELRRIEPWQVIELHTERVFLDAEIAKTASDGTINVLTYFANELRLGDRATPYSMVTAVGPTGDASAIPAAATAPVPLDLRDDEIAINSWLADDLGAKAGDELTLKYFVMTGARELHEESHRFHVRAVLPMEGAAADPSWMPPFPGITEVENCRDWKPGIPIDNSRFRPKDQDYWSKYRGTPKAFVSLATGQRLWQNRFGNLTAIRFPIDARRDAAAIEHQILSHVDLAKLGFFFHPVHKEALAASRQSMDFGELFIGFSFFLIVAALLLTAMLFVFNLEQRAEETGILLALGFQPRTVKLIFLLEGSALALLGALAGIAAGTAYTKLTLRGLATVWKTAVSGAAFQFHAEPATLAIGAVASVLVSVFAMWLAARGQARRPAAQLLASGGELELGGAPARGVRAHLGVWLGALSLVGALALIGYSAGGKNPDAAETFFEAGMLLLISGIAFSRQLFVRMTQTKRIVASLARIGMRGSARRPGRSLTTIGVLASGIFMIIAVSAFRQNPVQGAGERSSGTGGFALFGQATLPFYENLDDPRVRESLGIDSEKMKDVSIVNMRVREGDDASCLNLNRAQHPRLLGVRADELQKRNAFTFARTIDKTPPARAWQLLDSQQPDGAVPAIGDEQTIHYSLGKSLGDVLPYTDDRGNTFNIRIVAIMPISILQGSLVISERNFIERFPSSAGYRAFLIDTPADKVDEVATELTHALRDNGVELTPAWRRLADFQAVENTYLAIFQALGGLGLALGSLGLGIVVLRNVIERRSELALMQALGFGRGELQRLMLSEHWLLIFLGLAIGVVAAVLAVLPALFAPGAHAPYAGLGLLLLALAGGGLLWTWLAALAALRGPLLPALRNE